MTIQYLTSVYELEEFLMFNTVEYLVNIENVSYLTKLNFNFQFEFSLCESIREWTFIISCESRLVKCKIRIFEKKIYGRVQ